MLKSLDKMLFRGGYEKPYTFEQVFEAELRCEINNRILCDYDPDADRIVQKESLRGDGLPPFGDFQSDEAPRSDLFNKVLSEIGNKDQERLWDEYAARRRKKSGYEPGAHSGLVGLALSGGGIRSSTFNLGVIQALVKMRFFTCIDYLSTVSGGGYIGSCVTSYFNGKDGENPKRFPFMHMRNKPESPSFRHLRNNARFLAPNGILDYIRLGVVLVRGAILNFIVLVTPILLLAALTAAFWEPISGASFWSPIRNVVGPFVFSAVGIMLFIFGVLLYPGISKLLSWRRKHARIVDEETERRIYEQTLSWILFLTGCVFLVELQPWVLKLIINDKLGVVRGFFGNALPTSGVIAAVGSMMSTYLMKTAQKLWSKIGISIIGVSAIVFLWSLYILLSVKAIRVEPILGFKPSLTLWGMALGPVVLYFLIAAVLYILVVLWINVNRISLHNLYRDRLSKAFIFHVKSKPKASDSEQAEESDCEIKAIYEEIDDRALKNEEEVLQDDDLKLSELWSKIAPYHIINAAINIGKLPEKYQRGRNADFFIFSKLFTGGRLTKYCETKEIEGSIEDNVLAQDRHMNLATAMAISGAAAAPTMGKASNRFLAVLMTLFNIRLNYWLLNPRYIKEKKKKVWRVFFKSGASYILREILPFFHANHNSRVVNLSDGGHIDNSGVFQLLQRECRLIILGDGESDPEFKFEALSELARIAQIDLGIRIEFDGLDEIREGHQSHAVGTVRYKGGRLGKLIYLKSSLSGDYNLLSSLGSEGYMASPLRDDNRLYDSGVYLAHYKAKHPSFPHESTADQFFDEKQFECYRALGVKVALDALAKEPGE